MAIELPNGSWIQRTDAAGSMARAVCSRRRSWLSRGRNIRRYSPKATGCEYSYRVWWTISSVRMDGG